MNRRGSEFLMAVAFRAAVAALTLAALAMAASTPLHGQTPQVWLDPKIQKDTIVKVEPTGRKPLLFGFTQQVVDSAGLPTTAPMRSFCARARREGDRILVDSLTSRAEPELPTCQPQDVPLVIRPTCELTYDEHVLWNVQRVRPVILFCGVPPEVYLLAAEPRPGARAQ